MVTLTEKSGSRGPLVSERGTLDGAQKRAGCSRSVVRVLRVTKTQDKPVTGGQRQSASSDGVLCNQR